MKMKGGGGDSGVASRGKPSVSGELGRAADGGEWEGGSSGGEQGGGEGVVESSTQGGSCVLGGRRGGGGCTKAATRAG